ncbi:carotenoid oxygenase family protein [Actinomadura sp. KC06]|uniref:carotenoid oxygenase family protein n=1 Tax=Actinomadura sp. KC06 TaxID=2530369 RepID=UPI001A9FCB36|nr:carotenoid oxygenase family protein [Actinomadura sp. KC06]
MNESEIIPATFTSGFSSLTNEVIEEDLVVQGALPGWLTGALLRNGPALFDAHAGRSVRHWFDGQAMLHRFTIEAGTVTYTNRFLNSPAYRAIRHEGRITHGEFATDPCMSIFRRFISRFIPGPSGVQDREASVNANVNIVRAGNRSLAITEAPMAVQFDPGTLETLGVVGYSDDLDAHTTTAHPHVQPGTDDLVNVFLRFSRVSEYMVQRQRGSELRRTPIGSYGTDLPGYMHSFAITERYAVLVVYPFAVNALSFVLRNRPFIENYRWRPELDTRFVVLDLQDGSIRGEFHGPPLFAFHHINAFEDGPDAISVDICAYEDSEVIDALYLHRLRDGAPVPMPLPTRYRIDMASGEVTTRRLSSEPLELPQIAYGSRNGREYEVAYGVSASDPAGGDFFDRLCRLRVTTGDTLHWDEPGCYPGEPVFVSAPDATAEDDGVVLSVVLDVGRGRSFLLVLDASTFEELARAEVPHGIPFGFHGHFTPNG